MAEGLLHSLTKLFCFLFFGETENNTSRNELQQSSLFKGPFPTPGDLIRRPQGFPG